ncbi:MAG: 5,6-dimethylbenzimidazole synthase [Hyphomicrobiaceae bacterium]
MVGRAPAPEFDAAFRTQLADLVRWRRDVRRFRRDAVSQNVLDALLEAIRLAPSVGLSEPWRIVEVASGPARTGVRDIFGRANRQALAGYDGERARRYAGLKLAGLDEAPVQWAMFADGETDKGHGLGRTTMPETAHYSVVCAVMQVWLIARAHGVGVGWVSILAPDEVERLLDVPQSWRLVAYLCIGWPDETLDEPELQRAGWETRTTATPAVLVR